MTKPKVETVSLDALVPDPLNARVRDERASVALSKSVEAFGLGRSVVVDSGGVVRAGNGTLEAARAAGVREVVIVETDGTQLVAVKRPDWSEAQAVAYAIADNRTGDLSSFDPKRLSETMGTLVEHATEESGAALIAACGFDDLMLASILSAAAPPPASELWQGMPEFQQDDKTASHTLLVNFASEEDKIRFSEKVGQKVGAKTRSVWWPEVLPESSAALRYKNG